jgi:hypothetical protein
MRLRYGTAKAEHGSLIVGNIDDDGTVGLFVKFEHNPRSDVSALIIDSERVHDRLATCGIVYPGDSKSYDEHHGPTHILHASDVCVWAPNLTGKMISEICEWLRS